MSDRTTATRGARTNVQKAAAMVGVVFLLVGVLGFIPGITTNFSDLSFAGHHSDARLFGLFQVSILHNIVHLLFGIAGLALARTAAQARTYLVFGGVIYLVLFVYGLIVGQESAANFVPVNTADDILHLILGIGMIGLGLALTRDRRGVAGATSCHACGCDDERYEKITPPTAPLDGGLGSTRAAIGSLGTGTQGVVALSLIALPAQAAG